MAQLPTPVMPRTRILSQCHSMNNLSGILASLALTVVSSAAVAQAPGRPAPPRPSAQAGEAQPAGATARCRDGSFTTDASAGRCASNGGVLVSFPARVVPPAPAPRPAVAPGGTALADANDSPAARRPAVSAPPAPSVPERATPVRAAPASGVVPAKAPRAAATRAVESREVARPAGATAQCKDGTFAGGPTSAVTCGGNGGVAVVFPAERTTMPASAPANSQRTP